MWAPTPTRPLEVAPLFGLCDRRPACERRPVCDRRPLSPAANLPGTGAVMPKYSLSHLADTMLVNRLTRLVKRDCANTAVLLAHIAEVDERRLYRPAGHPSMFAYCVEELRFSEDAAYKRIRAARAGREFPQLLTAIANGHLHLTAVSLLAPHFTRENLDELIAAATHRGKSEIEELISVRFGVPGSPASFRPMIRAVAPALPTPVPATHADDGATFGNLLAPSSEAPTSPAQSAPHECGQLVPEPVEGTQVQSQSQNSAVFVLRVTISRSTLDKLRYAQALLSHSVPADDVAQIIDRALDVLIAKVERERFGVGARARRRSEERVRRHEDRERAQGAGAVGGAGAVSDGVSRYIPVSVREAVWKRDQGRCTFVSITGGRCRWRRDLEFDHVVPVARGGEATVENLRLRCSVHNQYEAERTFGEEFMKRKRQERSG
jgi:hypothetical protein